MTVEEKIAQADYFRKKVSESSNSDEELNKKLLETSANYSAYLSTSSSVLDYALYNANKRFNLNLRDEDHWTANDFKNKALETENWGAFYFVEWYQSRIGIEKGMSIGQAFANCRRLDIHKRPTYTVGFDPKVVDTSDVEKIMMNPNIFLQVEGFEQMKIDDACDTHFSTMDAFVNDANQKMDEIQKGLIKGTITPPEKEVLEKEEKEKKIAELTKNKEALEKKIAELEES